MAETNTIAHYRSQLASWKNRAHEWMLHGESIAERGLNAGVGLAAGAALGAARAKWGKGTTRALHVPGTEIDAPSAVALLGLAVGITGFAGKYSDQVSSIGSHIGACVLDRMVEQKMK
jgi:hypothetical protein